MIKKYPCIESTEDIVVGHYNVRLWVGETEVKEFYDNSQLIQLVKDNACLPADELAELIAKYPTLNAVQVKDTRRDNHSGIMIYTVDF